jgi:hypothetical protein
LHRVRGFAGCLLAGCHGISLPPDRHEQGV